MHTNTIFDRFEPNEEDIEFSNSTFTNSNFSKLNLSSWEFVDCTFIDCDFSMAQFEHTVFTRIKFERCKMLGVDFSTCSKYAFSVNFDQCLLNYSIFVKNNLKNTLFNRCVIIEASFSETDLNSASFAECDLSGTNFSRCNLQGCDFRSASNYTIDPSENKIKSALFSYPGVLGLLQHYQIVVE